MLGELCFAAEGLSGTAASASLRKLGSIMEDAPSGRLFGAISTGQEARGYVLAVVLVAVAGVVL